MYAKQEVKVSGSFYLSCKHCNAQYDLSKAAEIAKKRKVQTMRCPHCGKEVAKLN